MKIDSRLGLAFAAITVVSPLVVCGQSVPSTQPTVQQLEQLNASLQSKVQTLESRVSTLETKQRENQADTTAAIQQVLRDADSHSQLLAINPSPLLSGYAPSVGFVIRSEDGSFSMHPGLVFDFRNMTSYRQDLPKGGEGEVTNKGTDVQNGFDVTRMRLTLDGNYTEALIYYLQLSADQGNPLSLLDAYVTYRLGDAGSPWAVKAGQFKDPVWHERNLSEARLMAVDRSLVEDLLGGGQGSRIQGVSLIYSQDRFRGQVVAHDGFNSQNTKFYDAGGVGSGVGGAAGVTPTDYGVSGRGEYLVIGKKTADSDPYKEYDQFTAFNAKQDILVLGAGADYSASGSNNELLHSVDAQYDSTRGLGLYGAYLGSYRGLHNNQGVAPGFYYDPGFLVQASYLVTSKIEPFARYDYTHLAPKSVTGLATDVAQEITVGVNYYLYRQNVKLTIDGSWLPNGSPVDADALGILKDTGHNEFILRTQLQLAL